ncbi:hypothetical protein [Brevundimonas vesicularis]|uniref:hypothetical protein n=1 Tax=Brevundimonas vesicularis TaxID=41276 RepID=UPI0038D483D6
MTFIATLIIILLAAFPATSIGKTLRNWLVDAPARRLNRVTPGHLAFYLSLGVIGFTLFSLFGAEGLRLFSLMAPELAVWFVVFDVSLFLDVFLLSIALAATNQARIIRAEVLRKLDCVRMAVISRGSARARATKPVTRKAKKAVAEDPDPWGQVLAWC